MISLNNAITLVQAFESVGVSINPTVNDFYKGRKEGGKTASTSQKASIGETPVSNYTSEVLDSFASYNDAAIVIFTRPGGEGADLVQNGGDDFEGSQLNLNQNEKDVLALAKANFDKVIVILNCDNPIGIGELKEDEQIDAIIWAGGLGVNGANSLARLIVGQANFSGKLTDTFSVESLSSAAAQNCGAYVFSNASEIKNYVGHNSCISYVIEAEGIYIGYKYYETRYEDSVIGGRNADSSAGTFASNGNWNYTDEMGYNFGYGLSYTSFAQTLKSVEFNESKTVATVTVSVKNIGNVAGKDVVQVWFQSPYTQYDMDHDIEKSAIQLADYIKTDRLEPCEEKTYIIEVQMANCASYDSKGAKTFIMDAGDYYFAIGNGAHDGLNNILARKGYSVSDGMDYNGDPSKVYTWTLDELDDITFSTSRWTGEEITNLLDEADINFWLEQDITYLTRSDWTTFPITYDNIAATPAMIERLAGNEKINGIDYSFGEYDEEPEVTYNSTETDYALFMLAEKDFDDPMWNDLLDQLSMYDTALIVGVGNCKTEAISSINKQETSDGDGPTGFSGIISGQVFNGEKLSVRCYFSVNSNSATWNKELAYLYGYFLGEDALFLNKTILWGPGANLHRTPFSGRNAEYMSEDGILGFEQIAQACSGMAEKGGVAAIKHFAFNDQETNRNGISTFVLESSAREIILKSFEGGFTEGGTMGTMSSFPRVGLDYIGMCYNIMTLWLRDEIGFKGLVTTDMAASSDYMRPAESVKAGITQFDNNDYDQVKILYEAMQDDTTLQKALRRAAHYTLYAIANSNAMNGFDENSKVVSVTPWWKHLMLGLDIGFGVFAVTTGVLYVLQIVKKNKEEK